MAYFKNPNNPQQPQPGVYGWFVESPKGKFCIYIGEAGKRKSPKQKGTLLRGVTELQREAFSTDSPNYQKLDTDFVVETTIRYLERKELKVFWEHLSNDPENEKDLAKEFKPLIQNETPYIYKELKIEMPEKHYWKWPNNDHNRCIEKLKEAENYVFNALDKLLYNHDLQKN